MVSWVIAVSKIFYDRELAVSERSVKPATILHNASLILGKQIIHILPEGYICRHPSVFSRLLILYRSAMLNPDELPFCIDSSKTAVNLPIRINQTNPIFIELLRFDLDTNLNETLTVGSREINKLKRLADKDYDRNDKSSPRFLRYMVKEPGLYRLQKVVDESNLEVQRRISDTLVVNCPSASIQAVPQDKCKGDLSDFRLQVHATPPFEIKYSKIVNQIDDGRSVLNIHPENLVSPLARPQKSGALVRSDSSSAIDLSWARTQIVEIPLNESLGVSGGWQYMIDEVKDACGNVANYTSLRLPEVGQQKLLKGRPLEQHFIVHERPTIALRGYDSQHPVKVEKGRYKAVPIDVSSMGPGSLNKGNFKVSYSFTAQENIMSGQKHSGAAVTKEAIVRDSSHGFEIREPGLYTLQSVETAFCGGEVIEPSSCLLINPPEPDLVVNAENIPDKCAGNSIGLQVDLDISGTPPFSIFYNVKQKGGHVTAHVEKIDRLHTQLQLKPMHGGHYIYEFTSISDAVYAEPRSLLQKHMILEQDVRPPAIARILDARPARKACLEEPVMFAIQMLGLPPYTIEYELIHRGRRKKHMVARIQENLYKLTTEPLVEGGEYTLALTSITDTSGCKVSLKDEAKVDVSLQRPRAAFGYLEGKRSIRALENQKAWLPLRLQGEPPWTLEYKNLGSSRDHRHKKTLRNTNDQLEVTDNGTYQILEVRDHTCPGTVDQSADQFDVRWLPRPSVQVAESPSIEQLGDRFVRKEVCEGDEDMTDVFFTGNPPFDFAYEQRVRPEHGSQSMSRKNIKAGLNTASLRMETTQPGVYEYKFSKLGDTSYGHDDRKFTPLVVEQRVYPRPQASFSHAGKTYKYCQDEGAGDEVVPINLVGQPPFQLELEIKHHTVSKPERINIPNIGSNKYNLHIPHKVLTLGTHYVTIRHVQDARGCQCKMDYNAPYVQVSVADIPSISPLEERIDYCVGDRISFTLSGAPPFNVFYTFENRERKAAVSSTAFRRIAEKPGEFTITALSDQRSTDACKARTRITKMIHGMPSVRVSKGRTAEVDIHEGGEAEILFEFGGTPPFQFT